MTNKINAKPMVC